MQELKAFQLSRKDTCEKQPKRKDGLLGVKLNEKPVITDTQWHNIKNKKAQVK